MSCVELQHLGAAVGEQFDFAIFSGSYDKRALSCATAIGSGRYKNAIVAWNKNHQEYNADNFNALWKLCGSSQVFECSLDSNNPVKTADSFMTVFRSVGVSRATSVLVDVTAFTREALAILLLILKLTVSSSCRVVIVYNAAKHYSSGGAGLWLSAGIREVRSVLGYSGALIPAKPSHLIVLPGYEHERASELIASYEPLRLSLGRVSKSESISSDFYDLHLQFLESLAAVYESSKVSFFAFSAKDLSGTKAAVLRQAELHRDCNPVVACLNSKLAMVGTCLACFQNEELQLCYAQPEKYNVAEFSEASDFAYVEEISGFQ